MLNVQLAPTDYSPVNDMCSIVTKFIVGITALRPGVCHGPIFAVTPLTTPRITSQKCCYPLSLSPERVLSSVILHVLKGSQGPFRPDARIQCYPLQDLATFLLLVLILLNDIIYPYSHPEMPRFLVA